MYRHLVWQHALDVICPILHENLDTHSVAATKSVILLSAVVGVRGPGLGWHAKCLRESDETLLTNDRDCLSRGQRSTEEHKFQHV